MDVFRNYGRLQGKNSFPSFVTITDIRPNAGYETNVVEAVAYLKSFGVNLVLRSDQLHTAFHVFAQFLYNTNILEMENITPGNVCRFHLTLPLS